MDYINIFLQLIIAFGLLNVWVIRRDRETAYRGACGNSLKNEFIAYGLPLWSFYVVGFIKVSAALVLLLGVWKPFVVFPAAFVIVLMMIGAVCMHIKVRDPFKKFVPALIMLFLSTVLCLRSG